MDTAHNQETVLKQGVTRRQLIKAGGVAAVGLAFTKPLINTIYPKPAFAQYVPQEPPPECVITATVISANPMLPNPDEHTTVVYEVCNGVGECNAISFVAFKIPEDDGGNLLSIVSRSSTADWVTSVITNFNGQPGFPSVKFEGNDSFNYGPEQCFEFTIVYGNGFGDPEQICVVGKAGSEEQTVLLTVPSA